MLKKRLYTFIVANQGGGKIWRLSLPYSSLIVIMVLIAAGITAVGAGTITYGKLLFRLVDYQKRISENDTLRSENHNIRVQTAQLGEKIDFLETLSRRLMIFSGMQSDKSVGGVGGLSKEALSRPRPASDDPAEAIVVYNQQVSNLEQQFRSLDSRISYNYLVAAARPDIMPVNGYITEPYGTRRSPFDPTVRESHPGIDISAPKGRSIVAPADGTVIFAGPRAGYGNMVVIDHKFGITTRYGHMQRIAVQVGQHVSRYEIIGYVGDTGRSTGPHLHYEIWQFNKTVDPVSFINPDMLASARRPRP